MTTEAHYTEDTADTPGPFLTAGWFGLVMAQWPVPAQMLLSHLPHGVELDTFNDAPYVSLVGLYFVDTRVMGIGVPFHRNFMEVNLRFYVRRNVGAQKRRGVVFLRELVPRFWIACIAQTLYSEPYAVAPMTQRVTQDGDRFSWRYSWRRGGGFHSIAATASGAPHPIRDGSLEAFFAERYWGYTRRSDRVTTEYRVRHDPWRVWTPEHISLEWEPRKSYGNAWGAVLEQPPESVFVADGSPVSVSWGSRFSA